MTAHPWTTTTVSSRHPERLAAKLQAAGLGHLADIAQKWASGLATESHAIIGNAILKGERLWDGRYSLTVKVCEG